MTGRPAALKTDDDIASTMATMSIPRAQLDADFYFGEKQPSLHQMEGNGQFPRHVSLLPATLATRLGIPIRPGLRGEGTPSLPQPRAGWVGTALAGESGVLGSSPPWLCSLLKRVTLGKSCPFLGVSVPACRMGS